MREAKLAHANGSGAPPGGFGDARRAQREDRSGRRRHDAYTDALTHRLPEVDEGRAEALSDESVANSAGLERDGGDGGRALGGADGAEVANEGAHFVVRRSEHRGNHHVEVARCKGLAANEVLEIFGVEPLDGGGVTKRDLAAGASRKGGAPESETAGQVGDVGAGAGAVTRVGREARAALDGQGAKDGRGDVAIESRAHVTLSVGAGLVVERLASRESFEARGKGELALEDDLR